jgi:hypothetical protein
VRNDSETLSAAIEIANARERATAGGTNLTGMSDADIQAMMLDRAKSFLEDAPTSASAAANIILDGKGRSLAHPCRT